MLRKRFRAAAILAALAIQAVTGLNAASARPLTPAEQRYARWRATVPDCADPSVVAKISSRFADRESEYWQSGLSILGFDMVREVGFRSNGVDYIPRRYCEAKAVLNDNKPRTIYYSMGEDTGWTGATTAEGVAQALTLGLFVSSDNPSAGTNWGVDWCIVGLDRNDAYGLKCRAARP